MDAHIFVALVGALVNMGLSVTIPCLIRRANVDQPFLTQVKKVFEVNRQEILTSSLIVAITIYLALKVAPEIQPAFSSITGLELDTTSMSGFTSQPVVVSNELPSQLRNLILLK